MAGMTPCRVLPSCLQEKMGAKRLNVRWQMPLDDTTTSQSVCRHSDPDMLRVSQCADDEIDVIVRMAVEGQCPICVGTTDVFNEYLWRVEAVRKGHITWDW